MARPGAFVRSEESRLVLNGPGTGSAEAFADRLRQLDTEAQSLEGRISERSQSYRTAHSEVTIDAVQRAMPAGTVLVEYVVYRPFDPREPRRDAKSPPPRFAAFVLPASGDPVSLDIGGVDAVNTAVDARAGRFVIRRIPRSASAAARRTIRRGASCRAVCQRTPHLHRAGRVAEPVAVRRAARRHPATTWLSSRRSLTSPAVATCCASPPARRVSRPWWWRIRCFQVRKVGKVRKVRRGARGARGAHGAEGARVASLTGARFTPLPGTAGEASALAALIPDARVLTGAMATEYAVKQVHGPRLLHIATHGFFLDAARTTAAGDSRMLVHESSATDAANPALENPLLRSGLAFAGANRRDDGAGDDGILTASS